MSEPRSIVAVVIEDAPDVRILVSETLAGEGFEVHGASSGEEGLGLVEQEDPDVIVLDVGLPGIDGLETCRKIRELSDAYVVMLTTRADEIDKVVGLSVGADDYVTKPFSPRELVARIKAMLRRPRANAVEAPHVRTVGDLRIDTDAREVALEGETVDLTRIEFDLLDALTEHPRRVLSRDQLLERVWGANWVGEDHLVDVHISKLRRKLDDDPKDPAHIQTVRGVGYRMVRGRG